MAMTAESESYGTPATSALSSSASVEAQDKNAAPASGTSSLIQDTLVPVASAPTSVPNSPTTASLTPSKSPTSNTSLLSFTTASVNKKAVTHDRFKCSECGERLDNKNYLTNHMIREHNQDGEVFTGDTCDFSASRKVGLWIHKSKKYNGI